MLEDVVDEYIASLSVGEQGRDGTNHNTIVAYRNDLNQVCLYFRRQKVENWQQVTREHVAAYLLEMRDGFFKLGVLIGLHAFVELVARAKLAAAHARKQGEASRQQRQLS